MKKILLLTTLLLITFGTVGINIYASSQSINVTYKTYASANGISNGKKNKVWHYLHKNKNAYLKVTTKTGSGTVKAYLYRSQLLIDSNYGSVTASKGTHKYTKKLDSTSGSYYLIFHGGNANKTEHVKGWIYD